MGTYAGAPGRTVNIFALVRLAFTTAVLISFANNAAVAQTIRQRSHDVKNGERLYKSGCNACHGNDGRGAAETLTAFKRPETFPDFTDCPSTTPEPNSAWKSVIVNGGRSRGFSEIMPAFGRLLTSDQIDDIIAYLRTLCTQTGWPRGELNLPRPLITEKAFPENENVISAEVNARGAPGVTLDFIHERRFGKHNQIEIDLPVQFVNQSHTLYGGAGDVTLGLKREMWSSLRTGSIFSLFGGVVLPTGKSSRGLGKGTTTFETFAAFGQLFPTNTFVQLQAGAELPVDTDKAPRTVFWRMAFGQSFAATQGLGRMWSPMVEFVADRDLLTGAKSNWDVVPQMQVTISRRQHIRANIGFRRPFINTLGRQSQIVFYVLWDFGDGGLTKGW